VLCVPRVDPPRGDHALSTAPPLRNSTWGIILVSLLLVLGKYQRRNPMFKPEVRTDEIIVLPLGEIVPVEVTMHFTDEEHALWWASLSYAQKEIICEDL